MMFDSSIIVEDVYVRRCVWINEGRLLLVRPDGVVKAGLELTRGEVHAASTGKQCLEIKSPLKTS